MSDPSDPTDGAPSADDARFDRSAHPALDGFFAGLDDLAAPPPDAEVRLAHIAHARETAAGGPAGDTPTTWWRGVGWRVAAVAAAGTVAVAGLGADDRLPEPAQRMVSSIADTLGIDLPDGRDRDAPAVELPDAEDRQDGPDERQDDPGDRGPEEPGGARGERAPGTDGPPGSDATGGVPGDPGTEGPRTTDRTPATNQAPGTSADPPRATPATPADPGEPGEPATPATPVTPGPGADQGQGQDGQGQGQGQGGQGQGSQGGQGQGEGQGQGAGGAGQPAADPGTDTPQPAAPADPGGPGEPATPATPANPEAPTRQGGPSPAPERGNSSEKSPSKP